MVTELSFNFVLLTVTVLLIIFNIIYSVAVTPVQKENRKTNFTTQDTAQRGSG